MSQQGETESVEECLRVGRHAGDGRGDLAYRTADSGVFEEEDLAAVGEGP